MAAFLALSGFTPARAQYNDLLFGQEHSYSVVFRGNGEAIVYAKIVVTNQNTESLSEFSFEVPRATVSDLVAYQQQLPRRCTKQHYDYQTGQQICDQYSEPDYGQNYYGGYYGLDGQPQYFKMPVGKNGNKYTLALPSPLSTDQATAFIISYAAKGYVKNTAGLYSFDFETLKVDSRISTARVSVDVDTDLAIRGKRSEVNYQTGQLAAVSESNSLAGAKSASLDRLASSIGTYGAMVKQAKGLAAGESLSVKGEYARSAWRLYVSSIIWFIIIIAAIIVGIFYGVRFFRRRHPAVNRAGVTPVAVMPGIAAGGNLLIPCAVTGLVSAAAVIAVTFGLQVFSRVLDNLVSGMGDVFQVVMVIVVLLIYAVLIFGPGIWLASKRGWKALLYAVLLELAWLIILGLLFALLFQNGLYTTGYYPGLRY